MRICRRGMGGERSAGYDHDFDGEKFSPEKKQRISNTGGTKIGASFARGAQDKQGSQRRRHGGAQSQIGGGAGWR